MARVPRTLGPALRRALDRSAPASQLAAVQRVWSQVAGAGVAGEAQPVAERDGVVTISCRSAVWAQELDLLQTELLERLDDALYAADPDAPRPPLRGLRFTADAHRHVD